MKLKQIMAIIGIVILVALYIVTLISACLSFPGWQNLFGASLLATIAIPILIWILVWAVGKLNKNKD